MTSRLLTAYIWGTCTKIWHPGHNSRLVYKNPWCTTQVGGAQCRSMVHNVVLYSLGGAQRRSHKNQTDGQSESETYEPTMYKHRWAQKPQSNNFFTTGFWRVHVVQFQLSILMMSCIHPEWPSRAAMFVTWPWSTINPVFQLAQSLQWEPGSVPIQ